jgi:hypothetical protein
MRKYFKLWFESEMSPKGQVVKFGCQLMIGFGKWLDYEGNDFISGLMDSCINNSVEVGTSGSSL